MVKSNNNNDLDLSNIRLDKTLKDNRSIYNILILILLSLDIIVIVILISLI